MWSKVKQLAPLTALVGYGAVYMNKGWDMVLKDLTSITLDRVRERWQYFAGAIICGLVLNFIKKLNLPTPAKTFLTLLAYFLFGYLLAKGIDPPAAGNYSVNRGTAYNSNAVVLYNRAPGRF